MPNMTTELALLLENARARENQAHEAAAQAEADARTFATERDSLRRDLAVTRAALAQCATALRELRESVSMESVDDDLWSRIVAALSNPDVEHAVRVEAAREAVITGLIEWRDQLRGTPSVGIGPFLAAEIDRRFPGLAALTSERKS